jgi:DNA helicase II / ATP-dependent DNA helicase PcrA
MMENLLEGLNAEQKLAVEHKAGPLMIVAGAGTGKTMVVTRRIAWLIKEELAKPEEILALTFTDKAAGEMEERVDKLLPYGYVDLQISTFHSFCERLLRDYGVEMGLARDFRLLNELDTWLLMRQNLDRFELDYYRPLGNPTKYIKSLMQHFSRAKDNAITSDEYLAFSKGKRAELSEEQSEEEVMVEVQRLEELAGAYQTYQQILLENDCMDFGDLMLYVITLFKKRPNILKLVREKFKYVLVDEFQDTNFAQYELIKTISAPTNNLTVVGDDDQSIYKFRGASLSNILEFEKDYTDLNKVVLIKNYRSHQKILDHAYESIQQNNPNRLEAQSEGGLSKKLESEYGQAGEVEHIHCSTIDEEVNAVLGKILKLHKKNKDASWADYAILVRANSAAIPFIHALEQNGVPYQFLAQSGLYRKPVILDFIAYLHVLNDTHDNPSLYRLLTHPLQDIPMTTVAKISHEAKRQGISLFEMCQKVSSVSEIELEFIERITSIVIQLEKISESARHLSVTEVMRDVINETGFLSFVMAQSERKAQEDCQYLQQFYERIKGFELRAEKSHLRDFLEEFDHERSAGEEGSLNSEPEIGPDVIKVMTIHGSKGLEFRYVFVVNMVDQRFPSRARKEAIPLPPEIVKETMMEVGDWHLEEERRLFYVACTRAKEGLFFASADGYGGARKRKLSRFLSELGYDPTSNEAGQRTLDLHPKKKIEKEEGLIIHLPKHVSFTQLAAYKSCPMQFKFAHLLKIPVFGKPSFSYGKTMHNTLQKYFELWVEREKTEQGNLFEGAPSKSGKLPVSKEELLALYNQEWIDEWYGGHKEREEYKEKGKESLRSYFDLLVTNRPEPHLLEQPFTYKIGNIVLKGRIDRIDLCEGGVEIVDYKTGKPKDVKKLEREQKEQLWLYQLAARDVFGLEVKALTYHYLEDHSQATFLGTDKQLADLQNSIAERVQAIRGGSYPPKPGFHCQFCDFKEICEYRQ